MNKLSQNELFLILQFLSNDDIINLYYCNKYFYNEIKQLIFYFLKTRFSQEIKKYEKIVKELPNQFHIDLLC